MKGALLSFCALLLSSSDQDLWSAAVPRFVKLSPVSVPEKTFVKKEPLPSTVTAPLLGDFSSSDVIA